MNAPELNIAMPLSAASTMVPISRAGPVASIRCLIVTADALHADALRHTASEEGWAVETCANTADAMRVAFRLELHLAVVDLQGVSGDDRRAEFEQLASDLARNHVPLLVINGDPHDPLGEFAARQLGVWVYLAGLGEDSGLESLFREARGVTEKLLRDKAEKSARKPAKQQGVL
jgi:hypothetical protein